MLPPVIKWLLGKRAPASEDALARVPRAIVLHGRGDYAIDVIGVARYRSHLLELLDGMPQPAQRKECIAALVVAEGITGERGAVAIVIDNRTVGFSPAYLATQYLEWLSKWQLSSAPVCCNAVIIVSGERNQEGNLALGVKLDIELPFKMTTYY